jgi:hypothetical protein
VPRSYARTRSLPLCLVGPSRQRRFACSPACSLADSRAPLVSPVPSPQLSCPHPWHALRAVKPRPCPMTRPLTSPERLGEDPAPPQLAPAPHSPSLCSRTHLARSATTIVAPPSPPGLCHHLGHGELRLSSVHREPAVVSPFTNPYVRSMPNLSPAQTGARRCRDSSSSGQLKPSSAMPTFPEHRL